jgi:hypothetical protein
MSYTPSQIAQQNANFKAALDSGKITQAQYDQAMVQQNINLAKATTTQYAAPITTHDPSNPLNKEVSGTSTLTVTTTPTTPNLPPQIIEPPVNTYQAPITVHDPSNPLGKEVTGTSAIEIPTTPNNPQESVSAMPPAYWETSTGTPEGYTQIASPTEQAKVDQLSQISKENQTFIQARESGAISGAEYNTAIYAQYEKARQIEPTIPEGMVVKNVQTGTGRMEYAPLEIYQSNSFFGPINPDVAGYGMKNEEIPYIKVKPGNPLYSEQKNMSPEESRAITGMTLATSVAMPLGAGSVARAGVILGGGAALTGGAETYKYVTTGEHLTPSEAINTFGLGEVVGVGALSLNNKVLAPRVQSRISESYGKTLDSEELWKPSISEQVQMKVTGAKPNAPPVVARSTDLLTESYDANAKSNIELIKTDGYKKVPFGSEPDMETQLAMDMMDVKGNPWVPSPKQAEMIKLTGASPKPLASGTVSYKGGINDGFNFNPNEYSRGVPNYSQKGMVSAQAAEDSFDLAFSPKSSMDISSPLPTRPMNTPKQLPLRFALGKTYYDFKEYYSSETKDQTPTIETQDNSALSFTKPAKPSVFEQIKTIKNPSSRMTSEENQYWHEATTPKTSSNVPSGKSSLSGPQETVFAKNSNDNVLMPRTIQQNTRVALKTQTQQNSFIVSQTPYYSKAIKQTQDEEIFLSTPNSGLQHPKQPSFIVDVAQKQTSNSILNIQASQTPKQSSIFDYGQPQRNLIAQTPINDFPSVSLFDNSLTKNNQSPLPRSRNDITQIFDQDTLISQGQTPILSPIFEPTQTTKITHPYPNPKITFNAPSSLWNPPSLGSKYEGSGFTHSPFKVGGIGSRKRQYPIFTGEEVLKI